jgi:hypothetical protein
MTGRRELLPLLLTLIPQCHQPAAVPVVPAVVLKVQERARVQAAEEKANHNTIPVPNDKAVKTALPIHLYPKRFV